jgi:hypothetical protein
MSFMLYDALKLGFVYKKMKIHPFSRQSFQLLAIIGFFSIFFYVWEFPFHPLINIFCKSALIGFSYLGITFYTRTSEEINQFILDFWAKISEKFFRK